MKRFSRRLICLAAILPELAGIAILHAEATDAHNTPAVICPTASAYEAQVEKIAPKCVASTVGLVGTIENGKTMGVFSGSGVVVSPDGLILSAGHVVSKPQTPLNIRFTDGRVVHGVSLGMDHQMDTGMARITDPAPEGGWPCSPMATADSAKIGDWVLATGNPGSIVLDRNPPLRLGRVTNHDARILETNCALEPGDSGGPVFDLTGSVVGINSRIMTTGPGETRMRDYLSVHVPISLFATQWNWLLANMNAHPEANLNTGRQPGRGRRGGDGGGSGGGGAAPASEERLSGAIKKLVEAKDPEVLQLLADSKKNGNKLQLTPEQTERLIRRANWLHSPATTQPTVSAQPSATTQPAGPETANAAKPHAATQPAVAEKPQKGIAAALRPLIGPGIRQSLLAQFPGAKISDELLQRIMDRSSYDPKTKKMNVVTDVEDLKAMGVDQEAIAERAGIPNPTARTGRELSKSSLQTLALFAPALDAAGDCVVEIRDGNKPVLLGTIVDGDGWIVTKASDLPEHPSVVLATGRTVQAKVIGKDNATDLALIKIDTKGLTAVKFTDAAPLRMARFADR